MRLYVMRHAEAEPRGSAGISSDSKRPLTEEGQRQARRVAEGLKRLRVHVDLIVTSPYLRAVQTAEAVARVLGVRTRIHKLLELRSETAPADTSLALRAFAEEQLLCVGHEPHLSAWIAELVAGDGGMRCLMKKGGVASIELERVPPPRGSGTLRWLMMPKHLALISHDP